LLTRHQTSYSGSAGWYFRYQSIRIQITYTYQHTWWRLHTQSNFRSLIPDEDYILNPTSDLLYLMKITYSIQLQIFYTWWRLHTQSSFRSFIGCLHLHKTITRLEGLCRSKISPTFTYILLCFVFFFFFFICLHAFVL
jgi:hypothetical protein